MKLKLFLILIIFLWTLLPAEDYFQQKVTYHIEVKLLDNLDRLEAMESLTYRNNSSDSLDFLYFHLYLNRYKKDFDTQNRPRMDNGYQEIIFVKSGEGAVLDYEIYQTLMKVFLPRVLAPGDSQNLVIRFNAFLPPATDRLGVYGTHFDVGNWYPVPAVYDRFGWHADIHYEGEFYQEWGDYLVYITVPPEYKLGATGQLLADDEEITPGKIQVLKESHEDTGQEGWVTYRYWAPQVHDFAWTADPEYEIREVQVGETTLIFLIQPYRLEDWEPQIDIAAQAFQIFQDKIGPYAYPTLTIVDGYVTAGGIEYPNLVIINDIISNKFDLSATIIHEIAHQWFYGLLANNQTRYGWMDEGFATFFENLAMQEIYHSLAEYRPYPHGFFGRYFGYTIDRKNSDLLQYLYYIRSGDEEPIDRNFDWFTSDPFTPYYQKMGLVIQQLQLVLGDSLFWAGMRSYFDEWKYKHPYPADLQRSFEKKSQMNLQWFFDEWLTTTWHCDYAVTDLSGKWIHTSAGKKFRTSITFERKQDIVMPLDFRVYLRDSGYYDFRIPVEEELIYSAKKDSLLSAWSFKDRRKQVELIFSDKVDAVEIDPEQKLLDVNPFNNSTRKIPQVHRYWLNRQYYYPNYDGYTVSLFPQLFYNDKDGVQVGLRTIGSYLVTDYQHRLTLLVGLKSFSPAIDFWFEHPLYRIDEQLHAITNVYYLAGRRGAGVWLQWRPADSPLLSSLLAGWQFRDVFDNGYFPYPVNTGKISFLELQYKKEFWKSGSIPAGAEIILHTESPFLGTDFMYTRWSGTLKGRVQLLLSKKIDIRISTGGLSGEIPLQKVFRLGGESTYDFMFNPYLRTAGILPADWWRDGHVFQDGGGELRSLANNWVPSSNYWFSNYISLALGNPLHLSRTHIPYISDAQLSAYTSWSSVNVRWGNFSDYFGEAGASLSLLRVPFILQYFDIESIHFDFPFWVNDKIDASGTAFRWVIRLEIRSF